MKIEIYTNKSDGKIRSMNDITRRQVDWDKLKEMVANYNERTDTDSVVEVREATPTEEHLLTLLNNRKMVDRFWLDDIENTVGDILESVRHMQDIIGEDDGK